MKFKKGFTLAEILVVLVVIGTISALSIPALMVGILESQAKAGYKKAYNTVSNYAAAEKISGSLPSKAGQNAINELYKGLNGSLMNKAYAQHPIADSTLLVGKGVNCLTVGESTLGVGTENCAKVNNITDSGNAQSIKDTTAWMITEDNIAYAVISGGASENCATKQEIFTSSGNSEAVSKSCAVIIVDTNGLAKGPNTFEMQGLDNPIPNEQKLDHLTGDTYKIYMGIDGASAGPTHTTTTGRIIANIK